MPEILVYGKPKCVQCVATKRRLDKLKLPYRYLDVTEDQAAFDAVAMLGYKSLPVVVVGDMHWSEYRELKLQQLAELYTESPDTADLEPAAERYLMEKEVFDGAPE